MPALTACGHCEPGEIRTVDTVSAGESSGGEAPTCEAVCAARGLPTAGCSIVDAHTVTCVTTHYRSCIGGRLPVADATRRASDRSWLLESATLELAAVIAFDELARAIEAHAAPAPFAARARVAAADEVRHARALVGLAGPNARVDVRTARHTIPTLESLALHNAREGCVHEALAALDAAYQAHHAPDAGLRAAMHAIARDEARHALLALDLDAWARTKLDARARRALDEATIEAVRSHDDAPDAPRVGLVHRADRARLLAA